MLLNCTDGPPAWAEACYQIGKEAAEAGAPEVAYNLAGTLQLAHSGWLILSVPNAMVYGIYAAMHEPGIASCRPARTGTSTPTSPSCVPRSWRAHRGGEHIKERGQQFTYTLGRLYSTDPDGWKGVRSRLVCPLSQSRAADPAAILRALLSPQ